MSRLAKLFLDDNDKGDLKAGPDSDKKPPRYTILFVDDEPNVLNSLRRVFRQENYKIFTVGSGKDALELLAKEKVQLIISDHRMPEMTGVELLREVREKYPQTIRIMLTGHADDPQAVIGAVKDGAVYKFMTKPWDDFDLRLTVSLAFQQHELIQENKKLSAQSKKQEREIKKLSKFVDLNQSQLGRILLKNKKITPEQLNKLISLQKKTKEIVPRLILKLGWMSDSEIIKTIKNELKIDHVSPAEFNISPELFHILPTNICEKSLILPLKLTGRKLTLAMVDPTDFSKIDDIRFVTGLEIVPVLASEKEIIARLKDFAKGDQDIAVDVLDGIAEYDPYDNIEIIDEEEEGALEEILSMKDMPPAIRIVNAVISEAVRMNASDIHIEPRTKYVLVRFRIDGLLINKIQAPLNFHPNVISRIKILGGMDIAERRKPQDGRVTVKLSERIVDLRISVLPTINGEKVVLRLLDRNASVKSLEDLGLRANDLQKLKLAIHRPQGIILSTGPTGSGKTTTLYSLLSEHSSPAKNYVTIEDPVEYFLENAGQVMVKEKIGLDFAHILRAILRQDPNVIMLGEIRDLETAEVSFHAALTGHMVLSTLHTNSSIASIVRLMDLGVKRYIISSALVAIIAQGLVRKICPYCKEEYMPDPEVLKMLNIDLKGRKDQFYRGKGCSRCRETGYSGRIGLFEVFTMNEKLREIMNRDHTESELLRAAKGDGFKTLFEDGMDKVRSGETTCEEVLRVLGPQSAHESRCPQCNNILKESFPVCPFCGHLNQRQCANCHRHLESEWTICPYCGQKKNNLTK